MELSWVPHTTNPWCVPTRNIPNRRKEVGAWDYATNKKNLDKFFRDGLERNKNFDNIITIGMRGDGDVAMGKGNDEENMKVLHHVVEGQRQIIKDE